MKRFLGFLIVLAVLVAAPVQAQQTGSIGGKVTLTDGTAAPGVLVTATSDVLPRARTTTTTGSGDYILPSLPVGEYQVSFALEGLGTETRQLRVRLQQETTVDVTLDVAAVEEEIIVIGETPLIDPTSGELKNAISNQQLEELPVGQDYRDIIKLIPAVQYSEDEIRGPSAGGNGQDNVYLFDGVDVSLPLFGVLSAEPSNHDVEEVAVIKGGAKATDFNRSGGFTINTVSKSGTNEFRGEVGYQIQTDSMTGDRDTGSAAEFEEDEDWATASLGGPLWRENLFFYASYYRPTETRDSRANNYGAVPDLDNQRDEVFGKLTFTPTDSLLLHGSYRDSEREVEGSSVLGASEAGSTSLNEEATLEIGILEGSWVASNRSFVTFKYTDFANEGSSLPANLFGFPIAIDGSVALNVDALDTQGLFVVPRPLDGQPAYNAFITPLIERYGFGPAGMRTGGGEVGGASQINDSDYFREGYQAGFDYLADWGPTTHDLHLGYQWSSVEEDLDRRSNGWGVISAPGGRICLPAGATATVACQFDAAGNPTNGEQIFFSATLQQGSLAGQFAGTSIRSEFESQDIELNDTIRWNDWTFNAGVVLSNDTYFGQGLRPNSSNVSGFEVAIGHPYEMYDIPFDEMIQPRLGAVWAYDEAGTVYVNYARYHPPASSLPRAASWDRGNLGLIIDAHFDADGNLIEAIPRGSSSGKFFADDLDPRAIDEYMLGGSRQLNNRWAARAYGRYRRGYNFWEDTNNTARVAFRPPAGIPQTPYIPNLNDVRTEIGGSTYVIAELDGAFTKYYEATVETDYRADRLYLTGSYTWMHYYGNFDQDNSTTANDAAVFIGSSFLADGAGRQIWDNKYGNLRGDRRHQLKVLGSYGFDWNASAGFFAVYQSGQPWEVWDVEVYRDLTGSTSDTNRYAESAGSRTTDDHYQLDLSYTQNFALGDRFNVQLIGELFNVFDKQTGYNIQNQANSANFGEPRSFYDPRRFQLAARFQF
jgi:hypothetical protein